MSFEPFTFYITFLHVLIMALSLFLSFLSFVCAAPECTDCVLCTNVGISFIDLLLVIVDRDLNEF